MRFLKPLFLVTATLMGSAAIHAFGAQITATFNGHFISFVGEITQSDVGALEKLLPKAERYDYILPRTLDVDSPGGDWDAAMRIGRLLRRSLAEVSVADDAKCLSACVLLLAGAPTRTLLRRPLIGIHRPYSGSTVPISIEDAQKNYRILEDSTRAYLREMNMSDALFEAMVRIPPEKMRILTNQEISEFRLDQTDPALQEVADTDEAMRWNLTKREYLARKERVSRTCDRLLPFNDPPSAGVKSYGEKVKSYYACKDAIMSGQH